MNKKIIFIILVIVAFILITILAGFIWYNISLSPVGNDSTKFTIEIPIGSSVNTIAEQLENQKIIHNSLAFRIYVKMNNISNFQAGNYELSKNMSVSEIIELLQTGKVASKNVISITFLEGKNMRWVARNYCKCYKSYRR